MDWITGIQRALDYTEEHLTDSIDYETVVKTGIFIGVSFSKDVQHALRVRARRLYTYAEAYARGSGADSNE